MYYRDYLERSEFDSYEDFKANFKLVADEKFNFAYDVVDRAAQEQPDRLALVWTNDAGEDRRFTFGDISRRSAQAARFFYAQGIRKGDSVMLILKRRHEYWPAIMGLHKIGAVTIPATHLLTEKDIEYRANAADIKMVVTVNERGVTDAVDKAQAASPTLSLKVALGGTADVPAGWMSFDDCLDAQPADFPRPTGDETTYMRETMLLYFTSGTTGMPKMVRHSHEYALDHIITARYWHNVGEGELHLTLADSGWGKFAWGKLYGQWLCGAVVMAYDMDKFVATRVLSVIEKYGVATFCAPPTMYRFFIKEDLSVYDFSKLRHCSIAGEPLNPEVYYRFLEATGLKLYEGFGQTETILQIANFIWMEPKPGSMGKPSPMYDVSIVKDDGSPCDPGEKGEIVIKLYDEGKYEDGTVRRANQGMYIDYYRDEALTAEANRGGYYHTGDVAWADEDGFLWFEGRTDDVIKSSGYRIGPFEVESAILTHPSVLECAVTAAPDPVRGQVVKATIVLTKGYEPSDLLAKEIQEHVKKVTAPYKYPRIVEFSQELPKTISGKIRRVEIRESSET